MNAFQELAKHRVLHRDFKLANLFVNDETIVLGDFGFAIQADTTTTILGTPLTQAYELLKAGYDNVEIVYNSKTDLWSIGVVYYQMLFGEYPFMGNNIKELIRDIE